MEPQNTILRWLRALGARVRIKAEAQRRQLPEGVAIWVLGDQQLEVLAIPRDLDPGTLAPLAPDLPRLWFAEYIPPVTARRWIEDGRNFVDAVGNANLNLPGLLVRVLGNKPEVVAPGVTGAEWRGPALRLMFHLLCEPKLANRPVRKLAELAGVAPGTVANLFTTLERDGQLVRPGPRERRVVPDRELLQRWLADYGRKLHKTLRLGRFTAKDRQWHRQFDPTAHGACWGAEPAAERLGADLRAGRWALYTDEPLGPLLRAAGLRADPQGEVEVRRAFWAKELPTPRADTTPALLVVADLLATRDGRCHAAAVEIRTRYVDATL